MNAAIARHDMTIIDCDTHVTEPPDLWTSRLPAKWQDRAPRVEPHPETSVPHWRVGDTWLPVPTYMAYAGWKEYHPSPPPTLGDADPAVWKPAARLQKMDEWGVRAQLLYPNLLGFDMTGFYAQDPALALACVRAYNDFLTEEYYDVAPDRFIPMTVLPFWDLDASIAELHRCAEHGHRGVLVANKYESTGLPSFVDRYWDPLYAATEEAGSSLNFHIGFKVTTLDDPRSGLFTTIDQLHDDPMNAAARADYVRQAIPTFMGNAETVGALLTSGVCERFPTLKFVSVESGFGYVPYLLEGLDWHWMNLGARRASPDRLLPSEYFKRQCYGTFWFEKTTLALLPQFPDNFMWSTDFPHPTSVSPGPSSCAQIPREHVADAFAGLPDDVTRKALSENAARIYHLD